MNATPHNLSLSGGPYAIIGDLHGRVRLLQDILDRDRENLYHYVFVGDTIHHKAFFQRNKRVSPIRMLEVVYKLKEEGRATLVLGNHEDYVLQNLVMPDKSVKGSEVRYTLKSLKELPLTERLKFINMLSSSPLSVELNGKYRVAHAYYPHTPSTERQVCLHGPGYIWFRDSDLESLHQIDPSYTYFFGHYGIPYYRKNINIIDGTSLEACGVYYCDREEFMLYY